MLKFGKSVCIGNLFFTEKMILFIEIFGKKKNNGISFGFKNLEKYC